MDDPGSIPASTHPESIKTLLLRRSLSQSGGSPTLSTSTTQPASSQNPAGSNSSSTLIVVSSPAGSIGSSNPVDVVNSSSTCDTRPNSGAEVSSSASTRIFTTLSATQVPCTLATFGMVGSTTTKIVSTSRVGLDLTSSPPPIIIKAPPRIFSTNNSMPTLTPRTITAVTAVNNSMTAASNHMTAAGNPMTASNIAITDVSSNSVAAKSSIPTLIPRLTTSISEPLTSMSLSSNQPVTLSSTLMTKLSSTTPQAPASNRAASLDAANAVESLLMLAGQQEEQNNSDKYDEDEHDGSQPLFHMTMDVEGEEIEGEMMDDDSISFSQDDFDNCSQGSSSGRIDYSKTYQRGLVEKSVNYYQRMRMRNNEASKRCRLKRRIKQETLEKTRLLLERHGVLLHQRIDWLEKAKNLLTQAWQNAQDAIKRGDGQCDCLVYCQKISEIADSTAEKSDVTNDQLIRESKYLRETNLEELIGAEMNRQTNKPLRRGPRKVGNFDTGVFDQLITTNDRSNKRMLSDSGSSGGSDPDSFQGSGNVSENDSLQNRMLSGGRDSISDDIEVIGYTDRSNIGALDLSNNKRNPTSLGSLLSPTSSGRLMPLLKSAITSPSKAETLPPRPLHRKVLSAPKRLQQSPIHQQTVSLGPRDSASLLTSAALLSLRAAAAATSTTTSDVKPTPSTLSPRSSGSQITPNHNVLTLQQQQQAMSTLPNLAPKQQPAGQGNKPPTSTVINMPKLMPRDSPKPQVPELSDVCPTTIIVTPLSSSFSPTYLTIPLNRSLSVPSSSSSISLISSPSSLSHPSSSQNMPPLISSKLTAATVAPPTQSFKISPASMKSFVMSKSAVSEAPRPTVLSPPTAKSPPLTTIGLIKSEPETIIKTEVEDTDMLDQSLDRSMFESSQSTVVSSQGSSNIVDSSSQHMDTDYDDIEPPLTISTDEVDGPSCDDDIAAQPEVPRCAAVHSTTSCAGQLLSLNELNTTLDLKTMVPGAPGPHTTAEKYIIMSRLKLPYWEADEKLSWICLRHRTDIIHTTDGRTCAFCPRTKKLTRPIYIISYRIALTYYMTEGKFLDIGRGVCQSCRHKTFKSLDFHDCPVVTPNELASSETISSVQQASSSSSHQAASSSSQLQGQHSRILSAREEKPINLPTNPAVPSIKIKSLAAIQPVLNSTKQFSNSSHQLNRSVSLASQIYPMRGGDGQNFHPMRMQQQGRNVGAAVPQNFDNVRNKINDLNSAIHALNPRYRPLGFSITKLSDLGPSTLLETLTATQIAMETILSSIAPGQEKELWEAVLPYMTTKLINK